MKKAFKRLTASALTAAMIVTAMGGTAFAVKTPFTDVTATDWYSSYVGYAYAEGIFVGTSATTFSPLREISRSFFADSSYMLSFSVLCSCVCSRLISPSVSSWHKQDNTLMHQSPGHIQRRTPYNF